MLARRLSSLLAALALAALGLALPAAGPAGPSLEPVLGKAADAAWTATGAFATAPDVALGRQVLTVQKGALALDSKSPAAGARELRALLRLRTADMPTVAADIRPAAKDARDL